MNAIPSYSPPAPRAGGLLPFAVILGLIAAEVFFCAFCWQTSQSRETGPRYSAPALFNQANADARAGKTGLAVLSYERARLLAPNDPNIAANLDLVREQAGLPEETAGWLDRVVSWGSPNLFALLGCLGLVLVGAGILSARSYDRFRPLSPLAVTAGTLLLALTFLNAAVTWQTSNEAVVVTKEAEARISPAANGEVSTKLRAGETVTMRGRYQNFVLVQDRSGNSGWLVESDIAPVIPRS